MLRWSCFPGRDSSCPSGYEEYGGKKDFGFFRLGPWGFTKIAVKLRTVRQCVTPKGGRTGLETREGLGLVVGLSKRLQRQRRKPKRKGRSEIRARRRKTGYAQLLLIDVPF